MSGDKTPALRGLLQAQKKLKLARERLSDLETQKSASKRGLDRALRPLQEYYRSLEAGEREANPELESELRDKLASEQGALAPRAVYKHELAEGRRVELELINPELAGKLAGARQKVVRAEQELDRYLRAHFDDLVAELSALGVQLAKAHAPIVAKARKAHTQWLSLQDRWRPLVELADIEWRDFPSSPFSGVVDAEPLMPGQLAEGRAIRGPAAPKRRRPPGR